LIYFRWRYEIKRARNKAGIRSIQTHNQIAKKLRQIRNSNVVGRKSSTFKYSSYRVLLNEPFGKKLSRIIINNLSETEFQIKRLAVSSEMAVIGAQGAYDVIWRIWQNAKRISRIAHSLRWSTFARAIIPVRPPLKED